MAAVSDEARIRELAEHIRSKCAQAQQIRQQPSSTTVTSAAGLINLQPQQEVRRRLKEVVVRLHEDVRDNSLAGIQQRLQYTAGKFGLSFSVQRSPSHLPTCYMSSESFFLEVCLEETGSPVSTKLVLGREQQNSEVLTATLKQRDYCTFERHIRALVDMFSQYNGQEKSAILLQVIRATEQILLNIYNNKHLSPLDTVLLAPLGLVTVRQAGLPMNLMFYITPCESLSSAALEKCNTDNGLPETLGVSAKVLVEQSRQLYQLPKDPNLFDVSKASFHPLNDHNTISVPLTLVLCMTKDIPICANIMLKVQQMVYGADQTMPTLNTPHVNQLILQENKDNITDPNKHIVYLPGQMHTYFGLNSSHDMEPEHRGVLLPNKKVPFTHPSHVISIIHLLRQQLVYNTLFKSCLQRKKFNQPTPIIPGFEDYEFKVNTKPPSMITVTTELLNNTDSITAVRFEFIIPNDRQHHPTHPILQIVLNNNTNLEQSSKLNEIVAKCLSIPVTLHAMFSNTSLVPSALSTAISEHNKAIKQFHLQLVSSEELASVAGENMTVFDNAMDTLQTVSSVAGIKRKRVN